MRFCVLSSGSKGNCTYIEIENHKFLIDIGTNFLYTSTKLNEIGIETSEIEGIFITHNHEDHIAGLKRFIKMENPKIYISKKVMENIPFEIDNYELIEKDYTIDNIKIESIKLSHDTPECKGYVFTYNNKSLVYITDTGYINVKYYDQLCNKSAYILESNHDVDMLMNSNRYRPLKMRILGDTGHISNKDCSYYLSKFVSDNTKMIVLAHISEEANTPTLALEATKKEIKDIDVIVAKQNERTELIEI